MTAIIKNGIRAEHNPVAEPRPLPCTVCFDDSYVFPVAHRSGRSRLLKALVRFGNIAGCQVASCLQAETDLGCTAEGAQRQICLLCLHFHQQCWQISKVKIKRRMAKWLDWWTQVRRCDPGCMYVLILFYINIAIFLLSLPAHSQPHMSKAHYATDCPELCSIRTPGFVWFSWGQRVSFQHVTALNCPVTAHWVLIFLLTFTRSCDHICSVRANLAAFIPANWAAWKWSIRRTVSCVTTCRAELGWKFQFTKPTFLISEFAKQSSAVLAMYWLLDGVQFPNTSCSCNPLECFYDHSIP